MVRTRVGLAAILLAACISTTPSSIAAGQSPANKITLPIVSPNHSPDSLGETVYESQGPGQKNETVVPGKFVMPEMIDMPTAQFTAQMRKHKISDSVTIDCVLSANGNAVDLKAAKFKDRGASEAAMKAVSAYRFKPATLDGKPVAVYTQVVIDFTAYK